MFEIAPPEPPLEQPVFCAWVNMEVDISFLGKHCEEHINNRRCDCCSRSPQLDVGMKPDELLRNLRSCD